MLTMVGKIDRIEELPESCLNKIKILPESVLKSEIINKIILEVYNGWPGNTGEERVNKCIEFINERIPQYAMLYSMTDGEALTLLASKRNVNYTNWFQNANIPDLSEVIVFETVDDFKNKFPSGKYICCCCGGETTDYQVCNSGKAIDKKGTVCDWKVYGLFGDMGKGIMVLVKDRVNDFPKPITMFKPVELSEGIVEQGELNRT